MTTAIAIIILIACGFLYYGWFRLRQEISAKITQLIFRKAHREGERAVGRTHLITPKSVSAHALLEAAWEAIDVPASEKPHCGGPPASSNGARTIPPVSFSNRRAA